MSCFTLHGSTIGELGRVFFVCCASGGMPLRVVLHLITDATLFMAHRVVRYVGMATIWMNDYPWFKWVLLGGMGLFVLTSNEG